MALSYVQVKTRTGPNLGDPHTLTFDSTTVSGNAVIVAVNPNSASNPTVGITDNKSNTYTKVITSTDSTNNNLIEIWVATNITGGASHQLTFDPTSNFSGSVIMEEWVGLASVGYFDRSASATGTGSAVDTGNTSTTRVANEIIWAAARISATYNDFSQPAITVGSGYSNLHSVGDALYTESKVVSSLAAYKGDYAIGTALPYLSTPWWNAAVVTLAETNATTTTSTSSSTSTSSTSSSTSTTVSTSTSHSTSTSSTSSSTSISTSTSQSTSTSLSTSSTSSSTSTSQSTSTSTTVSGTTTSTSTSSTSSSTSQSTSTSHSTSSSTSSTSQSTSTSFSTSTSSTSQSTSTSSTTTLPQSFPAPVVKQTPNISGGIGRQSSDSALMDDPMATMDGTSLMGGPITDEKPRVVI